MCGIYGYIGKKLKLDTLFNAMRMLEYRGYDSCGIAYYNDNFKILKEVGNTSKLALSAFPDLYSLAIAHTRWATHGEVCKRNAHPHYYQEYIIVHNGIIDNYLELKEKYCEDDFYSETDSEVIAHLLTKLKIEELFFLLKGNYAILIIDKKDPHKIYFMKKNCPLLLCQTDDGIYLSSDMIVFPANRKALSIEDGSYGYITYDKYEINNINNKKNNCFFNVSSVNFKERDKEHLFYEILEQPKVIQLLLEKYRFVNDSVKQKICKSKKIFFIGCGSSYYAGMYLALFYSQYFKKEAYAIIASEFAYDHYIFDDNTLFIYLSQSGETADVMLCHEKIKSNNSILLTNVISSSLARKIDDVCYLFAYPEISVASTKAFTASIITGILIGQKSLEIDMDLNNVISNIENVISKKEEIAKTANDIIQMNHIFMLGRGLLYPLALEGSLKLREVSYVSSWGLASGELKHGTISLIDEKTLCIGFDTLSLKEIASRKGNVLIPDIRIDGIAGEISFVIYAQLLTYYVAKLLNRNVDQPKNLAKSVTVK